MSDATLLSLAVNMTARIQSLTSEIGEPLLVSADFARLVKQPMKSVGRRDLRGVAAAQALVTPEQDCGSATGSAH